MKITIRDFPGFLRTSRACLIYGPDEGQVRDTARQLITAVLGKDYDPLNLIELPTAQLKEDPALLADALNSFSLMGGERLVWLREPPEALAATAKELLTGETPGAYLLITEGELKPADKWRALFEKEKQLAALPCYRDDASKLSQLINDQFRARGITAEQGAVAVLSAQLGNDRGVTLQEIEKIDLFLGEERHLTREHASRLGGDNRELVLDDLCHAVCAGQPVQLSGVLTQLFEDGTQPIGVFRILHSHFQRLMQLKMLQAEGLSQEQAFERLRIFFKQKPRLTEQLRRWPEVKITRAQDALIEGELALKTAPVPPEAFCGQLLHRLALSAAAVR